MRNSAYLRISSPSISQRGLSSRWNPSVYWPVLWIPISRNPYTGKTGIYRSSTISPWKNGPSRIGRIISSRSSEGSGSCRPMYSPSVIPGILSTISPISENYESMALPKRGIRCKIFLRNIFQKKWTIGYGPNIPGISPRYPVSDERN